MNFPGICLLPLTHIGYFIMSIASQGQSDMDMEVNWTAGDVNDQTRNTLDCDQSNVYSSRVIFSKSAFSFFLFRPIPFLVLYWMSKFHIGV